MIVFDVSEPRYRFMEYLKSVNTEYRPELFLMFLGNSLFRICGITVSTIPTLQWTLQEQNAMTVPQLDEYITKWLPFDYMQKLYTSGHTGDYYMIKVIGNSGVLFHVNENHQLHHPI